MPSRSANPRNSGSNTALPGIRACTASAVDVFPPPNGPLIQIIIAAAPRAYNVFARQRPDAEGGRSVARASYAAPVV